MTFREPQGLARWANTDPSLHCNGVTDSRGAKWVRAWICCLNTGDQEAAALIFTRNNQSDECLGGAHEDCRNWFSCRCSCHLMARFPVEHPALRSLTENESERESELEVG